MGNGNNGKSLKKSQKKDEAVETILKEKTKADGRSVPEPIKMKVKYDSADPGQEEKQF